MTNDWSKSIKSVEKSNRVDGSHVSVEIESPRAKKARAKRDNKMFSIHALPNPTHPCLLV